jgi:NADPH:quinone reductase-like Zn-dependent oxidoreductase
MSPETCQMTQTCRAMLLPRFGAANLTLAEHPVAAPGPTDIVIRLTAASINYRDVVVVDGTYKPDMKLPLVPLSDGCGEVVAVGEAVSRFAVGDRAMPLYTRGWISGPPTLEQRTARTLGGPFDGVARERITVSEDNAVRAPRSLDDRQAATLPIAGLTAWSALRDGGARPGGWVLTMGTGGVALFALQFAKLMGASVVALTSTAEKVALLEGLGADAVLNYRETSDWADRVREITGGGADIAVETVGATLPETLKAMAFNGYVGVIGFLGAKEAPVDIRKLIGGVLRVQGIATGSRSSVEAMVAAIDAHGLKPVIDDSRFALADLGRALERQAARAHVGKIVVDIA